jgi:hypothetical protein
MVSLLLKNPQSLSLLAIQFSETDQKRFALLFPSVAPLRRRGMLLIQNGLSRGNVVRAFFSRKCALFKIVFISKALRHEKRESLRNLPAHRVSAGAFKARFPEIRASSLPAGANLIV